MIKNIFKPTFNEEFELMKRIGDERFGSKCKHENHKDGYCLSCLRKVRIKIKEKL